MEEKKTPTEITALHFHEVNTLYVHEVNTLYFHEILQRNKFTSMEVTNLPCKQTFSSVEFTSMEALKVNN